jgi:hypothetical protein
MHLMHAIHRQPRLPARIIPQAAQQACQHGAICASGLNRPDVLAQPRLDPAQPWLLGHDDEMAGRIVHA